MSRIRTQCDPSDPSDPSLQPAAAVVYRGLCSLTRILSIETHDGILLRGCLAGRQAFTGHVHARVTPLVGPTSFGITGAVQGHRGQQEVRMQRRSAGTVVVVYFV